LFSLPAIAETAGSDRRSWQQDGLGYLTCLIGIGAPPTTVARFLQIGAMLCGMSLPVEFQNELQAWLDARLDERFKRQQQALLTLMLKLLESMLNETLRHNGEAHGRELEQLSAKIQAAFDRIEGMLEHQQARIDRAVRGEPVDRMN
jgi:ElaB/YqjD/DUF883 family membrane-anchored ribosome-binding protein